MARTELKAEKELVPGDIPRYHLAEQMEEVSIRRKASDDGRALEMDSTPRPPTEWLWREMGYLKMHLPKCFRLFCTWGSFFY